MPMNSLTTSSSFWLADTWWYAMTSRCSFEVFTQLVDDRKQKGFTVIQFVVGVPPEISFFSSQAKNTGGHPFNPDFSANEKYFEEVDKKIKYLVDAGLTPCIYGAWGYHIDILGAKKMKEWWRILVERYSKYPVIFCLTGEVDLFPPPGYFKDSNELNNSISLFSRFPFFYFKKILKKTYSIFTQPQLEKRIANWNEVGEYVKSIDTNNRLLTVHPQQAKTSAEIMGSPSWLDINSIQSGHSKISTRFMGKSLREGKKPIINLEPWYEGIFDEYYGYSQRYAFWISVLMGACGHSYGAHGLWQMANSDDEFLSHWGSSDWKKALRFEGAIQVGRAKSFLIQYDWRTLRPNLELLSPHWSEKDQYLPFAAQSEKHIFIYIPNIAKTPIITFPKNILQNIKSIKIFETEDYKESITFVIKGTELHLLSTQLKDAICVLYL